MYGSYSNYERRRCYGTYLVVGRCTFLACSCMTSGCPTELTAATYTMEQITQQTNYSQWVRQTILAHYGKRKTMKTSRLITRGRKMRQQKRKSKMSTNGLALFPGPTHLCVGRAHELDYLQLPGSLLSVVPLQSAPWFPSPPPPHLPQSHQGPPSVGKSCDTHVHNNLKLTNHTA